MFRKVSFLFEYYNMAYNNKISVAAQEVKYNYKNLIKQSQLYIFYIKREANMKIGSLMLSGHRHL